MRKTKLFFVGTFILMLGGTVVHAQSWRNGRAYTLDKQYASYPCVLLFLNRLNMCQNDNCSDSPEEG